MTEEDLASVDGSIAYEHMRQYFREQWQHLVERRALHRASSEASVGGMAREGGGGVEIDVVLSECIKRMKTKEMMIDVAIEKCGNGVWMLQAHDRVTEFWRGYWEICSERYEQPKITYAIYKDRYSKFFHFSYNSRMSCFFNFLFVV